MVPDKTLQHDMLAELEFEPSVNAAHIGVAAKDGVITLTGRVGSISARLPIGSPDRSHASMWSNINSFSNRSDEEYPQRPDPWPRVCRLCHGRPHSRSGRPDNSAWTGRRGSRCPPSGSFDFSGRSDRDGANRRPFILSSDRLGQVVPDERRREHRARRRECPEWPTTVACGARARHTPSPDRRRPELRK